MARYEELTVGQLNRSGSVTNSYTAVTILEKNSAGLVTMCRCATGKIPSAVAGYAIGCILINSTTGNLYVNTSVTSASFGLIGAAISDNSITESMISDGQITTAKIAAANVTTALLASNAITETKISAGAVLTAAISAAQVTSAKMAAGAILTAAISTSQVTNAKLALSTVAVTFAASATTVTVVAAPLAGGTIMGIYPVVSTGAVAVNIVDLTTSTLTVTLNSGAAASNARYNVVVALD